jgi:hypothetical protein
LRASYGGVSGEDPWVVVEGRDVPVERAGDHEEIVTGELVQARVELAVVDQAAGLADYEERKDDPGAR